MMGNANKVSPAVVDLAFDAVGGPTNQEPMTWVRMNQALNAVYGELVGSLPVQDNQQAKISLERIRRIVDSSTDQITKDQVLLLVNDALKALA